MRQDEQKIRRETGLITFSMKPIAWLRTLAQSPKS